MLPPEAVQEASAPAAFIFSAGPPGGMMAAAAPTAWRLGGLPESYAGAMLAAEEGGPKAAAGGGMFLSAAEMAGSSRSAGTPAQEAALRLHVRAYGLILVGLSLVFAYLWLAAGSGAGTWARGPWYAAALAQAVVAGLLLSAAGGETRRKWGPPLGTTLLPFAAPLLHVLLLEARLAEPDGGDRKTEWAEWAGRGLALVTLASAGAAAGLYWRRGRARAT
jgi:hypothetical protein